MDELNHTASLLEAAAITHDAQLPTPTPDAQ